MKIVLTGGTGMVGKNILALESKHEILAPTRQQVDLLVKGAFFKYLKQHQPDLIIHCAGLVGGIEANMAAGYEFCINNLQMGMNVVQESYDAGVKQLINITSSCIYPRYAQNPIKEEAILTGELEPTNEGYAVAKITVARLVRYLAQQTDVQYKNYISCNLYGYWDSFEEQKSHMVPAVIHRLAQANKSNLQSVNVWGDGQARREFMFAEDLADFILHSMSIFDRIPIDINVGTGKDYTINEYYEVIAKTVNYQGEFEHDLSKPIGMKQKLVDITKIKSLGWKAKTSLEQGIDKTYAYYQKEIV